MPTTVELDKAAAVEALAYLGKELDLEEWGNKLEYANRLLQTYTVSLHEILREIEDQNLSADGRLIIGALLDYADRHRSATLRGIAQHLLDNLET